MGLNILLVHSCNTNTNKTIISIILIINNSSSSNNSISVNFRRKITCQISHTSLTKIECEPIESYAHR